MSTCFFIGHRDAPESIYSKLEAVAENCIAEFGVTEFIVGHYGSFDHMAARAVSTAKKKTHPEIMLTLLLPYLTNQSLPKGFDGSIYPEGLEFVPRRFSILRANCIIVDHCDIVIAHVKHSFGGAYQCLEYARKKEKIIINITE